MSTALKPHTQCAGVNLDQCERRPLLHLATALYPAGSFVHEVAWSITLASPPSPFPPTPHSQIEVQVFYLEQGERRSVTLASPPAPAPPPPPTTD